MKRTKILCLILLCVFLLAGCSYHPTPTEKQPEVPVNQSNSLSFSTEGKLAVHFIDVGQGDAILVQTPAGENMLIDGGGNDAETTVCSYLKAHNVNRIKVLVATHPHEDHIGALDKVVQSFQIENIFIPKITNNTKAFEDLLLAVKSSGLKIKTAQKGVQLPLQGLNCRILSPEPVEYEEMNDYSAVIKLTYGQQNFLFCGDASQQIESTMLRSGADLKANVLKVGHHGSSSSSSEQFLQAVAPKYAIISCSTDNPYGHPHQETLDRLNKAGISIWRTDQSGTIDVIADGNDQLSVSAESDINGGDN